MTGCLYRLADWETFSLDEREDGYKLGINPTGRFIESGGPEETNNTAGQKLD